MKRETADELEKARHCLHAARQVIALGLADSAAREAYLAIYHPAHAYIYEMTGRAVKTHRGMRAMFSQIGKNDARLVPECSSLLARAYQYKETADYGVGRDAVVPLAEAQDLIDRARGCIDTIATVLASAPDPAKD